MGKVTLTQFVHPNGRQREVSIELPEDVCKMAENQVLSCECAPFDYKQIIFYSHPKGIDPEEHPEDMIIAHNGPGKNSPAIMLEKLIKRVSKESSATQSKNK